MRTSSLARSGNPSARVWSARLDSPSPRSSVAISFMPSAPPTSTLTKTNASQPKIAFLRCCALHRPARAAEFRDCMGALPSRAPPLAPVSSIRRPSQGSAPSIPFDLGSADGERRAKPPHREVVGYPPLSELGDLQRREFHEAVLEAGSFEDLPGKWQAAILEAEQNRPDLRIVGS